MPKEVELNTEPFWETITDDPKDIDFADFGETSKKEPEKVEKPPVKTEDKTEVKEEKDPFDEDEEEEKKEPEKKELSKKEPEKKEPEKTEPEENPYQVFAEEMQEIGLFLKTDKPPLNIDELAELTEKTSVARAKGMLEQLFEKAPKDAVEYFKHRIAGGKQEDFFSADQIPEFDLTKADGQKEVIRFQLKREGRTPDEIDILLEKFEEKDTLADKAKVANKAIQKAESDKKEKLNKDFEKTSFADVDDIQKDMKAVKKTLSIVKELDGKPVTDKEIIGLVNYRLQPIKDEKGQTTTKLEKDLMDLEEKDPEGFIRVMRFIQGKGKPSPKTNRLDTALKNIKPKTEQSKNWVDELE